MDEENDFFCDKQSGQIFLDFKQGWSSFHVSCIPILRHIHRARHLSILPKVLDNKKSNPKICISPMK
ncbi:hypothetical protein H5410_024756 [Solanum commersonii]|uniref:Uncharacterized protein n=1 Tax=Solanum commersonii TaxID=4109 RepID=A0A9J5ZMW7_SOLCO|nr:hypothetical protein H5410_024756 [Solanum commersonii]